MAQKTVTACARPLVTLSRCERNQWNEHLFERNASVLKGVGVVLNVVVIVVWIGKKVVVAGENIGRRYIWRR